MNSTIINVMTVMEAHEAIKINHCIMSTHIHVVKMFKIGNNPSLLTFSKLRVDGVKICC
jgi:hypothetical protein